MYKTFIWTNNKKIVTWPLAAILGAILKIWKMPINNYFMQKLDKTSIYIKYQTSEFILINIVSSEINQDTAVERLNASCMSSHGHDFDIFDFREI